MDTTTICPECGAAQIEGRTCQDDFYQMLFWENEHPALGEVHHLTVLCYHLQHPSLYSHEGLSYGRELLRDFVERGMSPEEVRRSRHEQVSSSKRDWNVTGREGARGAYEHPPAWTITARDVIAAGADRYVDRVREWAQSVYTSLKP